MKEQRRRRNCLPITISCPLDLLDVIDESAENKGKSRSETIIEILKEKFQTKKK